jgi:hypothetical protein
VSDTSTETAKVDRSTETTKVEKPVIERGGYGAGGRTVSELSPPPPSVSVSVSDGDEATATEHEAVTSSGDGSE